MAISVFNRDEDPIKVMNAVQAVTHFGPGGRSRSNSQYNSYVPGRLLAEISNNRFLNGLEGQACEHFATQGDGNHFAFVGRLKSTGQIALVTHHGSRGLGAMLYKRGMKTAQRHTSIVSPRTPSHNAWIQADSEDGQAYWNALQIIRQWTKLSHYAIHDKPDPSPHHLNICVEKTDYRPLHLDEVFARLDKKG